ncbi:flagellar motor protein MotB [Caballeronia sp. BCC1704]|uniref:flagellar motor protein MotB n=1 Tax=Caballeronia sp. BCC1704 TaxID=2676300 RepID=UPI00158CA956|nr:flagellar motor protein MotB [Caballeronia sp. BCC1704]
MSSEKDRPIFIKRIVAGRKGHHGGAWKLAYADFMTAMMAFFLLMWLLSSTSPVQRRGIAEYFNMPLKAAMVGGKSVGMDNSIITGGGRDISSNDPGDARSSDGKTQFEQSPTAKADEELLKAAQGELERREQARLHDLQVKLMAALEANPTLHQFKQQIRIQSTQQGLRIEIVDTQKRPMFALSSNSVQPYMRDILREIGRTLNDVPNRIVVQGHTDAVKYAGGEKGYSNWELSADRANASRRELVAGGMDEAKVLRVLGLASTQNLNKQDPLDPENRRISIIVLNHRAEASMLRDDGGSAATLDNASDAFAPGATPLLGRIVPGAARK